MFSFIWISSLVLFQASDSLNDSALLKQKPYELTYHGELVKVKDLSDEDMAKVDDGNEQQIFDITNIMRSRFDLKPLEWDAATAEGCLPS